MQIKKMYYVLVTGGAGYIGSHTVLYLLQEGYNVIVVDNLCNSNIETIDTLRSFTRDPKRQLIFFKETICDKVKMMEIFQNFNITTVIHFAGLKSVSESINEPLEYYNNNVITTLILLECMKKTMVPRIVFSSSATVYGDVRGSDMIKEEANLKPLTPYGKSKLMCEDIIRDYIVSNGNSYSVILRYFNPVGCHKSGLLGENPKNKPNNLMPCITNAMCSKIPMKIFGYDYDTKDGTAVRDYIHVCDLAQGHIAAVKKLERTNINENDDRTFIYNMGNGIGYSVKEMIETMEKVTNVTVPRILSDRRAGDAECVIADPRKAFEELSWKPKRDMNIICASVWKWKSNYQKLKKI